MGERTPCFVGNKHGDLVRSNSDPQSFRKIKQKFRSYIWVSLYHLLLHDTRGQQPPVVLGTSQPIFFFHTSVLSGNSFSLDILSLSPVPYSLSFWHRSLPVLRRSQSPSGLSPHLRTETGAEATLSFLSMTRGGSPREGINCC